MTVENGTYKLDKASDSLIYTGGDENVTVKGGSFYLGNVGTGSNGSPWIFNAKGQNTANIIVNGGTFNADIIHQFYPFEVMASREKALVKGADGMWSFVEAVAYVNEQEWSSKWYTNEVGYATLEEALAAVEDIKTRDGKNSLEEFVTIIGTLTLTESVANENNRKIVGNIVLAATNVTLKAPESEALSVTTNVAGYKVVYENGVYKLAEISYVAQIGDVKYESIQAAIDAAQTGETIKIIADLTIDVDITKNITVLKGDKNVTVTGKFSAGTYDWDVKANCASGYYADNNGDGTWTVKAMFEIDKTNMRFGNNLSILFGFAKTNVNGTGYYAVITRTYADGSTDQKTVPYEEWQNAKIGGVASWAVEYNGIAAKEMADEISVKVYATNGTEDTADDYAVSTLRTDSIQRYAMSRLGSSDSAYFKTLIVDMLNYGANAQTYFNYNTDNLANAEMTPEQLALGTSDADMEACNNYRTDTEDHPYLVATNVRFGNNANLLFKFKNTDNFAYAVFTYTNYKGSAKEIKMDINEFNTVSGSEDLVAEFTGLVISDARNVVVCTIYDENDQEITEVQDSLESYVARKTNNTYLYNSFIKFADSSREYMLNK